MYFKKVVLSVIGLTITGYASAATQTWDFVYGGTSNWNGGGTTIETGDEHNIGSGSYIDMQVGGVELVLSAWSSTENGSCSTGDPSCDPDPRINRADLKKYGGGLGAVNTDEVDNTPNHAFDNVLGNSSSVDYDMLLMEFDTEVLLEEIDINWKGDDSDITVLNYTGLNDITDDPFFDTADTWYSLLSQGWNHVGNYANLSTSNNQVISGAFESKYWLVGVYNPSFGDNWTNTNDAIKIAGVVTSTTEFSTQVPEPASYALVIAGLLVACRRRRQK